MNQKQQPPKTVSELYPSPWLKARDLARPVTVAIEAAAPELIFNPRTNEHEYKTVIAFHKCQKRLIANKTQCRALWDITGSENFSDWPGHMVTVSPGQTRNHQPTIVISAPPANGGPSASTPMPEAQPVEAAARLFEDEPPPSWDPENDAAYSG